MGALGVGFGFGGVVEVGGFGFGGGWVGGEEGGEEVTERGGGGGTALALCGVKGGERTEGGR